MMSSQTEKQKMLVGEFYVASVSELQRNMTQCAECLGHVDKRPNPESCGGDIEETLEG